VSFVYIFKEPFLWLIISIYFGHYFIYFSSDMYYLFILLFGFDFFLICSIPLIYSNRSLLWESLLFWCRHDINSPLLLLFLCPICFGIFCFHFLLILFYFFIFFLDCVVMSFTWICIVSKFFCYLFLILLNCEYKNS
jgi:hypothetical protein